MTPGSDWPSRPGPVARLLGSLANALIDLGLPTIREWLRERLGPAADVMQVTTDGSLVHLDGVRVPIGPRGLLVLDRATASITALGRAGLPEMRLHAFSGVLEFADDATRKVADVARSFRAEVSFVALPEPEEAAWIWGELTIHSAAWSAREGSPGVIPMHGRARLFVSSREWRVDGGRLDGEVARAHFAGGGVFEPQEEPGESKGRTLLVSRALSTAALSLEHARVGPFVDAASALVGQAIAIPSFVPLDAQLDGTLSWAEATGGTADLRVVSDALRASVGGAIAPDGSGLRGQIDADVVVATLLLRSGVPREAIPRDEDVVRIALAIAGDVEQPEVSGTIHAAELGFRFGRPRFAPPLLFHELTSEVFVKEGRAVLRASALAPGGRVTVDLDANIRELGSARGTLRADGLEAAFVRSVAATLGARILVPEELTASIDFTLAPRTGESGLPMVGSVTLSTAASTLVLAVSPASGMRITGGVTVHDVLAAGLFKGALRPTEGDLVVELDVLRERGNVSARGSAAAGRLVIELRDRPTIVLEGVSADVAIARSAVVYEQLRFRGHGGRFVANGTIPFTPDAPADVPWVHLQLEEGGADLAEAILCRVSSKPRIVTARDGDRPSDELWLPRDLVARGSLTLLPSLALTADVTLETPGGTAAELGLRLAAGGVLDGSMLRGAIAARDLVASGALGPTAIIAPEGLVELDVLARGRSDEAIITGWVGAARLDIVAVAAAASPIVVTEMTMSWRLDGAGVMWNRLEGQAYGGSFASTGVFRFRRSAAPEASATNRYHAHVSLASIAVHELPAISGRKPSDLVRGRLEGEVTARWDRSFHASGHVTIHDAAFPALAFVRPVLARYGLRPPSEDASAPVTASIAGTDWGVSLRDVKLDLRGATVRGEISVSCERVLDGRADVTLEEEYLRTSKVLTLPRVLTDRLVIPVRVEGPVARPSVHADLGESLGLFLKDNRVRAFVESAVEEAQILLGRYPVVEAAPASTREVDLEIDAALEKELAAHSKDWEELARRRR